MPVPKKNIYKEWFVLTDDVTSMSRVPVATTECKSCTYMQFKDVGYNFVIFNAELGEVFNFNANHNFKFEINPSFCYDKITNKLAQCYPKKVKI